MPDLKAMLRPLENREMPDRWDEIRRRQTEPIKEPRPSRAGALAVAIIVAGVMFAVVTALWPLGSGSSQSPASVRAGISYSYDNVPVTYDTITGNIKADNPGGTFTQATGTPEVTQQQAVTTAASRQGGSPHWIVTGYLDWEGATTWKGGPVWIVSFQGGDTCPPLRGPGHYGGLCAGTVENAIIDATTGDWIATFSNGSAVKQGTSSPEQSLSQIFRVND